MEICYLYRGEQTYRVHECDYKLVGGDVFITLPDETHSTGNKPEERGVLYWMLLRLPQADSFFDLPREDGRAFASKLTTLPRRQFAGSRTMRAILDDILLSAGQPSSTLQRLSVRNHLIRYLLEVIACAEAHVPSRPSRIIKEIVSHIQSYPESSHDLEELAARANLSLSRFKARFKSETGTPPKDFILRTKIDAAADRLAKSQEAITKIAFRLGFSSSQYFATVFKRYTGQTPLEFRSTGPRTQLRDAGEIRA